MNPATSKAEDRSSGMCYEDFEVDKIYTHPFGRTMTDADNVWFTLLSLGMNQIHFNYDYASKTPFGRPIIPSPFTLAVITGLSTLDFGRNTIANLEWTEIVMPKPVFVGDTLYARSKVVAKRTSEKRPYAGIVEVKTEGFNQDGVIVLTFSRKLMVYRRGHTPPDPFPTVRESTL
jgi:acyl dehydratase